MHDVRSVVRSCIAAAAVCALALLALMVNGRDSRTVVLRVVSTPPNTCFEPLRDQSGSALCLDNSHTSHLWLGRLKARECATVSYVGSRISGATIRSVTPAACGAP